MTDLIGDLLDAGSIDAGTLSVDAEPSDAGALIDAARGAFLAGGTGHDVAIDLPADLPRVLADRARVVQVLGNLLANAARHAPPSPIRVAAALDGGHVELSVADGGRGVAPEELPNLFRKYAGRAPGAGASGRGLGLAICKGIVEAHGGRIRAESAGPGTGTLVAFTLPVAADAPATAPAGTRTPADGGRARVLVVDDDPRTLRFVREALDGAGFDTMATGNFRDLARILDAERPALVLLDLVLPGSDGLALLAQVPALAELPVIVISAYDRDETIARALDAGADDYLVKPFSATELTARVRAALRRRAGPAGFALGELAIDYRSRRATLAGRELDLTATEHDLLCALAPQRRRRVLLRRPGAPRLAPQPRRPEAGARLRPAPARQARRRRRQARLHPHRARRRLPHGDAAGPVTPRRRATDRRTASQRRACYRTATPERPRFAASACDWDDGPCHTRNHIPPAGHDLCLFASGDLLSRTDESRAELRRYRLTAPSPAVTPAP